MDDAVSSLLGIATDSILVSDEPVNLDSLGFATDQLAGLLQRRNGFYVFESALHVFPVGDATEVMTLGRWNDRKLWIRDYHGAADDLLFFAEDALCNQFALRRDGTVARFDPETAYCTDVSPDIRGWAVSVLADYKFLTAWPLIHEWQLEHGAIPDGQRLCAIIPFILGGDYTLENLYAGDPVERMGLLADLHLQLGENPAGTRVKLEVGPAPLGLRMKRLMARARDVLRLR
jgi:hypothetical protein